MSREKGIPCPYEKCPDGFHPLGTRHCPNTGGKLKVSAIVHIHRGFTGKTLCSFKNLFVVLTVAISLYSLFCTVYSDIIIQNNNSGIFWPYEFLRNRELSTTLEDFFYNIPDPDGIEEDNPIEDKKLYILVLDCSGSIQKIIPSGSLKDKYKTKLSTLNESLLWNFSPNSRPTMFDIAKLRICQALVHLRDQNKKLNIKNEFSIWKVGNESEIIYPKDVCRIGVGESTINTAIRKIWEETENSLNTDFLNLFRQLHRQYEELQNKYCNSYETPSLVIIIFSDLHHDIQKKYLQQKQIEANWEQLVDEVQQISYTNIMANMIVLTEGEPDIQKTIFPIFKKNNIYWYRLNKSLIGSDENNDFLYTATASKRNINFFYVNSYRIEKTSFMFMSSKKNDIRLDIPSEIKALPSTNFSLYCEHLGAVSDKPDVEKGRMLISGGSSFNVTLGKGEKLRLTYSGRLPSNLVTPLLRFTITDTNQVFLIPIDFVKRLPVWAAGMMSFLYTLFWLSILLILYKLVFLTVDAVKKSKSKDTSKVEISNQGEITG